MESQVSEQCRACLSTLANRSNTNWRNIFTDSEAGLGNLWFIIKEVTGHELKQNENLPESICPLCLAASKTALNFKRRLEKSLQLLEQYGTRNEPEETITIDSESEEWEMDDDLELLTGDKNEQAERKKNQSQHKERSFKCSQCSKTFINNFSLRRHHRTHTAEQHFQCSYCSKSFPEIRNLNLHLRLHAGERPFKCSQCSKTFTQNHFLKHHLRIHSGQRSFECSYCLKSFTQRSSLTIHLRTHGVERPFECSHCSKVFKNNSKLKAHLLTHTGERPFECVQCAKSFNIKSNFTRHLRGRSHLLRSQTDKQMFQGSTARETLKL